MENCRLLMRICSNAPVTCDVPMVHSVCLLKFHFHIYIYGDEPLKPMKLSIDFSSVTQSFLSHSHLWVSEGGEVMEGGFQKSLQLSVASGYCVYEDDICVDLSGVLDGRPKYANIPISDL